MNIILTEQQFSYIIQEEFLVSSLRESLLVESASFNNIIQKIKAYLIVGVASSVIIAAIARLPLNDEQKRYLENVVKQEQANNSSTEEIDPKFNEKVNAVRSYMEYAAKNQNFNPESIQLSPEYLVKICNKENFDLPLLLAQAHMESCFGLTPRARKTNSVFSVGSYDNGKDVHTYNTQNDSVKPYIDLMKNDYLGDKSIEQMLTPGQMVNQSNNRYASNPKYENSIKNIRNRIIKMYPELIYNR